MEAYVVEDQYRNNQVLVYALDAEDARTAASNKKEFCEVEWADLLVKRAEYADGTDLEDVNELVRKGTRSRLSPDK